MNHEQIKRLVSEGRNKFAFRLGLEETEGYVINERDADSWYISAQDQLWIVYPSDFLRSVKK